MKKIYLLTLLLSIISLSVNAQWSTDPMVNTIVNNLNGSQAVPHMAYTSDGNFYVGFYSNSAGNYDIRLQYFTFDGVAQWASDGLLVSGNPQNSWVTDWDLTVDNNGNCVLAFNDVRDGNANVYAYCISPTGSFLWGADGIALTTDPSDEYAPSITVNASNNTFVSWQRSGSPYNVSVIQKVTPTGTLPWGSAGITYQAGAYSYGMPHVLGVEGDNFILAFYKETGSFPALTRHIYVQKFDGTGNTVWPADVLVSNSNGINNFNDFVYSSDGANGIVIGWQDDRNSDMNINTAFNRILSDGTTTWPANGTIVATISSNSDQNPNILGVTTGDELMVSWSRKNGNQSQTAIAVQKFSNTGVRQFTDNGIDLVPMATSVYGVNGGAVFDGTNAMIVYEMYDGTTSYQNIYGVGIDNNGATLWTPASTLMAGTTTSKSHNVVSTLYNSQLITVWEDGSSGSDIYMQNLFTDGSIGVPPISTDATLADLTVNGETVPGFQPDIYLYYEAIPAGDPLPITGATPSFPAATVQITQATAVPGTATVLVTAEDGVTQLTYTVEFYVASTDATLMDLTVDGTTIPGFAPDVFSYDYNVPTGDPIPYVWAVANEPNALVEIYQATGLPGIATVVVTAEDGQTTNTYTVNFLYNPGTDATLQDLLVGGVTIDGFDPMVLDYSYAVVYNDPAPYVQGIPSDPLATVDDTQCLSIPGDAVLVVTAEDGVTSLTYTVHFYFLGYDATLADLTVDGVTIPGFDPAVTEYQYLVSDVTPIPVVDGTPSDPDASMTITQAPVIPGDATIEVVAADGVTSMTYTVSFYMLAADATLADLTTDGITVDGFDPLVTYYEVDVLEGQPVPVTDATPSDPLATYEVIQATVVPGDASVVVTAQDGFTQLTYTVHFNLITGVSMASADEIVLYPNPVVNRLFLSGMQEGTLELYNLLGERILSVTIAETQSIDMSGLKEGIYFAKVKDRNNSISTHRIIKR